MSADLIRLECLKIAAQTLSPNSDFNGLMATADEMYRYITTGVRIENEAA